MSTDAESWVDRYGDALFRFAVSKTQNETVAEDLVQETFVAAVSSEDRFRHASTMLTWLIAILRRKIADHFRRQSRQKDQPHSQISVDDNASKATLSPRDWRDDPVAICENREFWETFDACVDKLPRGLAEVFILREINEQTPREVRELLGVSATNLSMRFHRSRMAMRDCLNRNWFNQD